MTGSHRSDHGWAGIGLFRLHEHATHLSRMPEQTGREYPALLLLPLPAWRPVSRTAVPPLRIGHQLLLRRAVPTLSPFCPASHRRLHRLLLLGVTRHQGFLCHGCRGWRRRFPTRAPCPSCKRTVALNGDGWCRLCWRQAAAERRGSRCNVTVPAANRHGQQLFIADTFRQRRRRPPSVPPPAGRQGLHLRAAGHYQPALFDVRRDFTDTRQDTLPQPPDAELAEQLDGVVHQHAVGHGWSKTRRNRARQAIRILLALQETPGAPIHSSEAVIVEHFGLSYLPVLEVLASGGLLIEDRAPAILAWFTRQVANLPEPMASEVSTWFDVLRLGSTTPPRTRPRAEGTARLRVRSARPALQAWASAGHTSLREITRADVLAALPPAGTERAAAGTALRSLFGILKGRKLIFTNPTARLHTGRPETRQPLPLDLLRLREAIDADRPERAALATLIAFHAVSSGHLRSLQLTDLRDGRMRLPDRTVPLAAPARQRIRTWLDHHTRRWPATANPHLFINIQTAVRTTPVSGVWIRDTLGMSAQTIREDRILHEAVATGGDIRRLCDLFGLSVQAAERYASILGCPIEPTSRQ